MMLEHPEKVVDGLRIAAHIVGARRMKIGVELNKPDAIEALKRAAADTEVEICPLRVKYPQGGEKQLIKALTGRRVPSGALPMDVGCVVMNATTSAQLSDAVRLGWPLTHRVITVGGLVQSPCNLRVPIGVDIGSVIEQAGGPMRGANQVILGGPMMGMNAFKLDTPTVKATGGIVLLDGGAGQSAEPNNCIRCASCVAACPMGLMPLNIYSLARHEQFERAGERERARDCIECGSCAYACPAQLPLVQLIRVAKRELAAGRK